MKKNVFLSILMLAAINFWSKAYCMDFSYSDCACMSSYGSSYESGYGSSNDFSWSPSDYFNGIFRRIYDNNTEKIKRFVEKYGHMPEIINVISENSEWNRGRMTPLSFALDKCQVNDKEKVVILLLDAKAVDVNTRDSAGDTPLSLACKHMWLKSIEKLLNKGANLHVKNKNGDNPMNLCLTKKCKEAFEVIKLLIYSGGKDLINEKNTEGKTIFHKAFEYCNPDIIKLLIKNGATIDDEAISMARAMANKYPDILEYINLIKEYTDIEDKAGFIDKKEPEKIKFESLIKILFFKLILEIEGNESKSIEFTDFGKFYRKLDKEFLYRIFGVEYNEDIYKFIKEAANKNEIYFDKDCMDKHVLGSKMFVVKNSGKFVDCVVRFGETDNDDKKSVDLACENNNQNGIKFLSKYMIFSAIESGDSQDFREIIKTDKLCVNIINNDGMSPLFYACNMGNKEFIHLLLAYGAKVDKKSFDLLQNKPELLKFVIDDCAIMGKDIKKVFSEFLKEPEIKRYIKLIEELYESMPNNFPKGDIKQEALEVEILVQRILNKKQDAEDFKFLVKYALGKSLDEKSVKEQEEYYLDVDGKEDKFTATQKAIIKIANSVEGVINPEAIQFFSKPFFSKFMKKTIDRDNALFFKETVFGKLYDKLSDSQLEEIFNGARVRYKGTEKKLLMLAHFISTKRHVEDYVRKIAKKSFLSLDPRRNAEDKLLGKRVINRDLLLMETTTDPWKTSLDYKGKSNLFWMGLFQ